jgi:GNAT superfamily N-acetyltransferase
LLRLATRDDVSALARLIDRSARALQRADYTDAQIDAALASVYGADTTLIDDGTFFIVEIADMGVLAACGGWSRFRTLYGGDRWAARDDARLDPAVDAAKIRAFFVDSDCARRGVGSALLAACEGAARAAGFRRFELGATLTGVRLFERHGYEPIERVEIPLSGNLTLTVVRMVKADGAVSRCIYHVECSALNFSRQMCHARFVALNLSR